MKKLILLILILSSICNAQIRRTKLLQTEFVDSSNLSYSIIPGGGNFNIFGNLNLVGGDYLLNGLPLSLGGGSGDMLQSIYDPQNLANDVYDRAHHTGEQDISTISHLQDELDDKQTLNANLTGISGVSPGSNDILQYNSGWRIRSLTNYKIDLSLNNVENTALSTWGGTSNITTLGTIGTGTWNGGLISGQYGGTGVNNSGKTMTLGNNFTTSGNFALTLTQTGTTNVTLPTTGTLTTLTGSETFTNKTLTSPVINSPTGIVKGDVGLGNVDNTSDATKDAATTTLTNKTISGSANTITGIKSGLLFFDSPTLAPADATVYYFGSRFTTAPTATTVIRRAYIPITCTIKSCIFAVFNNSAGTTESVAIDILKNGSTAYSVGTMQWTGASNYITLLNSSMSAPVTAGDYIEIRISTPTWVTNPGNSFCQATIYYE